MKDKRNYYGAVDKHSLGQHFRISDVIIFVA